MAPVLPLPGPDGPACLGLSPVRQDGVRQAHQARVEVEPEVFGLFRDLIPAAIMAEGGDLVLLPDSPPAAMTHCEYSIG